MRFLLTRKLHEPSCNFRPKGRNAPLSIGAAGLTPPVRFAVEACTPQASASQMDIARICRLRAISRLIQTLMMMIAWLPPAQAVTNQLWFPVGERLLYKLYWGIVPVGWAELKTEWVREGARRLIMLRIAARTSSIVDMIYPVDDSIESVVDPETFLPIRYVQQLREGRHVRDDQIIFNHKECKAYWKSGIDGKTGEIEIAPDSRDVLCLMYYMRSKGFACRQKEKFRVLVDNKLYDLEVTGLKHEEVDVQDFGIVQCLKVEPKAKFGEIFVRKGRVQLWFSEDDRHICTVMTGKIPVASVKAILVGVEGPGADFWSKGRR